MEVIADDSGNLEKVYVDLPNHWRGPTGESMWAKPLGDGLYEIDNIPFYAYGINYGDVVFASQKTFDQKPQIERVVRPSGHRTIRVIFFHTVSRERQDALIESFKIFGTICEREDAKFIALDVAPDGKFSELCERLMALLNDNILEYETCESRLPGSFDFYE